MSRSARHGLNLVEVLVIVAIIVVLAGLFLPATRRVQEAGVRMSCMHNLKQMTLALHNYYVYMGGSDRGSSSNHAKSSAEETFPPGCIGWGAIPEEHLSWMVAVLPHLEQQSLYGQFDLNKGYAGNLEAAHTNIKVFRCPADHNAENAATNYVGMAGIGPDAARQQAGTAGNGFMGYTRLTSASMIKDGLSNTFALLEVPQNLGPWARGGQSTLKGFDPEVPLRSEISPFGGHTGGFNASMADGSNRFVTFTIDPKVFAAAITIADGEPAIPDAAW